MWDGNYKKDQSIGRQCSFTWANADADNPALQHQLAVITFYPLAIAEVELKEVDLKEVCRRRYTKDIAVVEIFFATPFITKLKRDVWITFVGKISNIGCQ